jgi:hypothetical protein
MLQRFPQLLVVLVLLTGPTCALAGLFEPGLTPSPAVYPSLPEPGQAQPTPGVETRQPGHSGLEASARAGQEVPGQATATPVRPADPIQLAWFYKPPSDGDILGLASRYDMFILTRKDEAERDALRSTGVSAPILQYLVLIQIQNPGSCEAAPSGNQVAYLPGDFCRLRRDHPGWFLLDANGEPIEDGQTAYMDPGNPEYRAFWLERARRSQEELGWEGVFIDNVEASLATWQRLGKRPARYPDEGSYQEAIAGFLEYLYLNYFQPEGRPVWANITGLVSSEAWFRYLNYLDGAMLESFAVDWSDGYRTVESWEEQMAMVERAQDLGKRVILVSQGERTNTIRQLYALASYLLANQGLAYFRYADHHHYNEVWFYDNYLLELSAPQGRRTWNGTAYERDFTGGRVIVDPRLHTARIELAKP